MVPVLDNSKKNPCHSSQAEPDISGKNQNRPTQTLNSKGELIRRLNRSICPIFSRLVDGRNVSIRSVAAKREQAKQKYKDHGSAEDHPQHKARKERHHSKSAPSPPRENNRVLR